MIKDIAFRKTEILHDYAVYFLNDDGTKTWGFAESMSVYNPGETVELENGQKVVIDYEL